MASAILAQVTTLCWTRMFGVIRGMGDLGASSRQRPRKQQLDKAGYDRMMLKKLPKFVSCLRRPTSYNTALQQKMAMAL